MNIEPTLNLNKHPKDCDNLSLVSASGMKLANDQSMLTNEEGVVYVDNIHNALVEHYGDNDYDIVGIIPCNTELVIIVKSNKELSDIFRYTESDRKIKLVYNKYLYSGGIIKGTYTYNVEGSLIIAIAEDASALGINVPLKTINLGNIDDANIANDLNLKDDFISVVPTVRIPRISYHEYIPGAAYKGWYYMFIRFKINTIDYTQWYSFGYPIYVDDIKPYQIMRYCYDQKINLDTGTHNLFSKDGFQDGYGVGCSDSFSDNTDISSETFKFGVNNYDITHDKYQIGLICSSKSYTKAFRTSDLNKSNNTTFTFDSKQLVEASAMEFIEAHYNYFNVNNIINYNNRLYISNYKENSLNNKSIIDAKGSNGKSIIDNITVKLKSEYVPINDIRASQIFSSDKETSVNTSQHEDITYSWDGYSLDKYFNISPDTNIKLKYTEDGTSKVITKIASDIGLNNRNNEYPSFIAITFFDGMVMHNITGDVEYENLSNGATGIIRTDNIAIAGAVNYINPSGSFKYRRYRSTLIPGEVYNFFIHFVDKYGSSTNGYKLTNKDVREISKGDGTDIVPIKFEYINSSGSKVNVYAACNSNTSISQTFYPYTSVRFFKNINSEGYLSNEYVGSERDDVIKTFINIFSSIHTNTSINSYNIEQVFNSGLSNNYSSKFGKHTNNNGDVLFKIPEAIDTRSYTKYSISLEDVVLPEGYVGYFISYEEFEPTKRVTGFLTRADFRTQSKIINGTTIRDVDETSNLFASDKMFLYSSKYDISDSIKLDYNVMTIIAKDTFEKREIIPGDYWQRNKYMKLPYDMNKPNYDSNNIVTQYYSMPEYKLAPADSIKDNRAGLGTALEIKDSYNLFSEKEFNADTREENIVTYIAELHNVSNNLYMSKNKTLIRLSDVIYSGGTTTITNGYNGRFTYDGVLIYDNNGVMFNEADFTIRRLRGKNKRYYPSNTENNGDHSYKANRPFANYIQFGVYDDYFYESKSFNNAPTNYIFPIKGLKEEDSDNKSFFPGNMVEPKNSIDLFQNKQGSQDMFTPKVYTNYRDDLVNVSVFNKTVRRSNVIQDESRVNAWRIFPIEGYKNIAENKGDITNLVGIGTYLLVHTQHSLFMFNRDASLQTKDKEVMLAQPDAFEVDYTEVFTSDLGYGGLQDSLSYVVDQFGYIFYNESFKHLYRFDNGKLSIIDDDFYLWLEKYKPHTVRMANDKYNSRILIKFEFDIKVKGSSELKPMIEVFSFNYGINKLVSSHPYIFDRGYNTETETYFITHDVNGEDNKIYSYDRLSNYGHVQAGVLNPYKPSVINLEDIIYVNSQVSIIVNTDYEAIKFIEYIKYKVRKVADNASYDYSNSPVEGSIMPYAGDIIRVFGEACDTGELDVSMSEVNVYNSYTKPHYELGTWNFNYLRNTIDNHPNISAVNMTRIYGNYIIIQFIFNNEGGELIELEEVTPALTKQRNI